MKPLDARERRFVDEYLVDLDPQRAAVAAGYSATMARTKAYQWVSKGKAKPHVYAAVLERMNARSQQTGITAERVLLELGRLAFFDLRKLYREDGSMLSPHEWDDDTAAAMAGLEIVEELGEAEDGPASGTPRRALRGYTKKAKVFDKGSALTLAMRHLGMLKDKMEVAASVSISLNLGAPADG